MPTICYKCKKSIARESISCSLCLCIFHPGCAKSYINNSKIKSCKGEITAAFTVKVFPSTLHTIDTDMSVTSLDTVISMLRTSDTNFSVFATRINETLDIQGEAIKKINDSLIALPKLIDTLAEHSVKMNTFENAISQLEQKVSDLQTKLTTQSSNSNNCNDIVLAGFPHDTPVEPKSLTVKVFTALGPTDLTNHILSARILKRKSNSPNNHNQPGISSNLPKPFSLVVTLTSASVTEVVIQAKRAKKDLFIHEVLGGNQRGKIFVNELLPSSLYELLRQTKTRARHANFKFAWYKSGSILVRKNEGQPKIAIRKAEDLENLI